MTDKLAAGRVAYVNTANVEKANKAFDDKEFAGHLMEMTNIVWNEAIEAAAKLADSNNTGTASSNQIRALKK